MTYVYGDWKILIFPDIKMNTEINPELNEKAIAFSEALNRQGIKIILSDLDDTEILTASVFSLVLSDARKFLIEKVKIPTTEDELKEEMKVINSRLFENMGVNPDRWLYFVQELSQKYSLGKKVESRLEVMLAQIYNIPIPFAPGAEDLLQLIKQSKVPLKILTHANVEWTRRKYNWLRLDRFMKWDDIHIVSEDGHKTADSWLELISKTGYQPHECVVFGDSPRTDINPARSVGVKYCFLIDRMDSWAVHHQPVDAEVIRVTHLDQIYEAILEW